MTFVLRLFAVRPSSIKKYQEHCTKSNKLNHVYAQLDAVNFIVNHPYDEGRRGLTSPDKYNNMTKVCPSIKIYLPTLIWFKIHVFCIISIT